MSAAPSALTEFSASGAPVGRQVTGFTPPPAPGDAPITGRFVTLEPLDPRHADELYAANDGHDAMWDYMGYGPFDRAGYDAWVAQMAAGSDPAFYAARDHGTGRVAGVASLLRIDRANGVIEIGHIAIAPAMQRTPAASEAIILMIAHAFAAGYRRVEWKCNALNAPSMRAAARYGFEYEGTFRNHMVIKGRNRDTAWWAITDGDWPAVQRAHQAWLSPENFDASGKQRQALGDLLAAARGGS